MINDNTPDPRQFYNNRPDKSKRRVLDIITSTKIITKSNILYTAILIILLFPILVKPYDDYFGAYFNRGDAFVNFTYEELDAAKWIEKNIPHDYLIYSDPFTVVEFRGLTYHENLPQICCNQTVINLVRSAMVSQDPADAYHKIVSLVHENNTLIIITPRTFSWLQDNVTFVQFPAETFETFKGFDKFLDSNYFKTEYSSRNIFVFSLRHNSP